MKFLFASMLLACTCSSIVYISDPKPVQVSDDPQRLHFESCPRCSGPGPWTETRCLELQTIRERVIAEGLAKQAARSVRP